MAVSTKSFVDQICSIPGGESIRLCIQCGTCTASCPNADRMEYTPSEIIAMARAGMRQEVLKSNAMWYCLSCYLCSCRCPRGVKPTELAHALDSLGIQRGFKIRGTRTPVMYQSFVGSMKGKGRVHEFGMMLRFYLFTNPLSALKVLPVGIKLFIHRRLPLLHKKSEGKDELSRIIQKFREVRSSL